MNNIRYFSPRTLADAVKYLADNEDAKVLAGGTDLVAKWKKIGFPDMHVMDIRTIEGFSDMYNIDGAFFIGAGTTIEQVQFSQKVIKDYPILAEAASKVGSVQIRNMATIGGNSCNAAPSADTVLPLIVYGAEAVITSLKGDRKCLLRDFFVGPGKTVLSSGEMLKGLLLPVSRPYTFASFSKHSRRVGMDLATVGVAVKLCLAGDSCIIDNIVISLGAVGPVPVCVDSLQKFHGADISSEDVMDEIVNISSKQASPITDVRGTLEYRREMIRQNVKNCLLKFIV